MKKKMRRYGTGSYEHSTKSWRLRGKGIKMSVRQLSEYFGKPVPASEKDSLPFWKKYLEDLQDQKQENREKRNPTLKKINETLADPEYREHPALIANRERIEAGFDRPSDLPFIHPKLLPFLNLGIEPTDVKLAVLSELLGLNVQEQKEITVFAEVQTYLDRYKANKSKKGWYEARTALNFWKQATGNIPLSEITVEHYRKFLSIIENQGYSETSEMNRQRSVHTFLKRLEADYDLRFSFIRNPDYKKEPVDGQKVQYTLEQVKLALSKAEGIDRFSLLMGLNCGFYWGDIIDLTPEKISEGYLKSVRSKLKHKKNKVIGCWKLWEATQEAMTFGLTRWALNDSFSKFKEAHNLPEHKALRKFATQWIQDNVGEEEARLYRCEKGKGTHHSNYVISYTTEQVAKLTLALAKLAKAIGI